MPTPMVEKQVGGHRLVGYSLAGEETVIAVPELNVCFDVGRAPREIISIDHVLLSHGHMDHAAGVAYYFSQRCFVGNAPGCVLTHPLLIEPIHRLMEVWGQIERHPSEHQLVGLAPGEEFTLRRGMFAVAFAVQHGGPCLGFSIVERRHKLLPQYADHTGPQLVALKKKGVQITRDLEMPLVAYCGDTAPGDFFDLDIVRNAKVLITECTFFEPDHVSRARAGNHTHVIDLPAILERVRSPHIVLTHVSRRSGIGLAKRTLRPMLNEHDRERVVFLMDRPRHARPDRDAPRSAGDVSPQDE
jgi:ribonuclease Z